MDTKLKSESEKKISTYLKDLALAGSSAAKKEAAVKKIRFNEVFQLGGEHPTDELAGVCIDGIHYYDFKNVRFINNTGMACLIDLFKCLLEQGVRLQFVNVNDKIKNKIKLIGLENILMCS